MRGEFSYADEHFADLHLLRYRLKDFKSLSLNQKCLVYCLAKATLYGRDITFDQFGKYNLRIRRLLEVVYLNYEGQREGKNFKALELYLKRVWFSNGIYHHYGCDKFSPEFTKEFLKEQLEVVLSKNADSLRDETLGSVIGELFPIIFNPAVMPKRVNKANGEDLVETSACNYYEGVSQKEVEDFYASKSTNEDREPSWGLNSKLVKDAGEIKEIVWKADGLYGAAISKIIYWLSKAAEYSESDKQKKVIELLIRYYETGDLGDFDDYSIEWVRTHDGLIDFINGFIEVYGDPLGIKASWEGIVEIKDLEATKRAQTISDNAQWFEDNSPVDPRFRKPIVKGVVASVVCAAMLGGDEYPSTAIGINLPNADWIRAEYGSKSVTISNLTEAYNAVGRNNGFLKEFVINETVLDEINKWGDICDDLHTDLHECLGHGSGRLLQGVSPDALKAYGNVIEEARADLFGLYYIADKKLVDLGLTPNMDAYKSQYYTYMMNGLMTQLVRVKQGNCIEEAHMRNRALIAYWTLEHSGGAVELVKENGKTFVRINDYGTLRDCFAKLLAEVQRIKSTGDFEAARELVEKYAVNINQGLHKEMLERYASLNIAPYKGFLNPKMSLVKDSEGKVVDVDLDYTETYTEQMLRYSKEYSTLI